MQKVMKNVEIINTLNTLIPFMEKDLVLPVRLAYAINKNRKSLMAAQDPYEESRSKLVQDRDDSIITQDKFETEVRELLMIDVSVDIFTVSVDVLDGLDGLTARDMMAIDFLIEDESVEIVE